jgi:hypothetical protein
MTKAPSGSVYRIHAGSLFMKLALVINPSFLRMQESRKLHMAMDSRIRGNDGDGFVTKAMKC